VPGRSYANKQNNNLFYHIKFIANARLKIFGPNLSGVLKLNDLIMKKKYQKVPGN